MQNFIYSAPNSQYGTPQRNSISTKSPMNNQNQIMPNEAFFFTDSNFYHNSNSFPHNQVFNTCSSIGQPQCNINSNSFLRYPQCCPNSFTSYPTYCSNSFTLYSQCCPNSIIPCEQPPYTPLTNEIKVAQFKKPVNVDDETIFNYLQNHTKTQTYQKYGVGFSRMERILRQMGSNIMRRRKTTKEQDDFIEEITSNELIYTREIKKRFEEKYPTKSISRTTIGRRLKERKFKYRKLKKIQKLTEAQKYTRFNFSYNMLENYSKYFPCIVFSDECRFANDPDNRQHWLLSDDFREKRCARCSKFSFSTMAWGAIGIDFKSKLVFPQGKIDHKSYRDYLIESRIFEDAALAFHGKYNYIFQEDGASPHMKDESFEFIEEKAKLLYGWPPNSPDLSPIEMVWGIMKNHLYDYEPQPTNKKELENALLVIWDKIDQETINMLVSSFQRRLEMCLEANGGSISHLLSSGRKRIKKTDKIDRDYVPYLLTNDDNVTLYKYNQIYHHKWTKISEIVQNTFPISPVSVKCRVRELEKKAKDFQRYPDKYDSVPKDIIDILPIEKQVIEPLCEHADEYFTVDGDNVNDFVDVFNDFENETNDEYEEEEMYEEYDFEEEEEEEEDIICYGEQLFEEEDTNY